VRARQHGIAGITEAQSLEAIMATLEYKGYIARIDADEENEKFHGRVINISDVVNFKGRSVTELKREFARSIKEYFAFCREEKVEPEQPFSGKFVLRVDPAVHRAITRAADREGVSINKWAESALEHAAQV
jgi:predicted HicB family RNase H-like nuclease